LCRALASRGRQPRRCTESRWGCESPHGTQSRRQKCSPESTPVDSRPQRKLKNPPSWHASNAFVLGYIDSPLILFLPPVDSMHCKGRDPWYQANCPKLFAKFSLKSLAISAPFVLYSGDLLLNRKHSGILPAPGAERLRARHCDNTQFGHAIISQDESEESGISFLHEFLLLSRNEL
jgi:hypothetical protein